MVRDPIDNDAEAWQLEAVDVLRIATTRNAEVRSHQVTLAYWEMSRRLDELLHANIEMPVEDPEGDRRTGNANWFTLATWAIATVGRNIRSNELPRRVDQMLPSALRAQATPWVLSVRSSSGRRVARALSYGQIVVFVSTMLRALEFVEQHDPRPPKAEGEAGGFPIDIVAQREKLNAERKELFGRVAEWLPNGDREKFEEAIENRDAPDTMKVLRLLSKSLVGSSKPAHDLVAAFQAYDRARQSRDPVVTAKEIFRGNLIIAAVEQVLLDHMVTAVIDHVPKEFEEWFETKTSLWLERLMDIPRSLGRLGTSHRFERPQEALRETWARFLTEQVLVLALPTEILRLGKDIPIRASDGRFLPAALRELPTDVPRRRVAESDADQHSTRTIFSLFDRSRGDGVRTGAWDWRRFDDRLNYVSNLLRSRQQDRSLFWQPYDDEDRDRIKRGRLPHRTGDPFEQLVVNPTLDPFGVNE